MSRNEQYIIDELKDGELERALALVRRVFMEYEAPDYSDEGARAFGRFIEPGSIKGAMAEGDLKLWVCRDADEIVGVIAARPVCHVSLLFVDGRYHRRGRARRLLDTARAWFMRHAGADAVMTVNSSPYAAEAYRSMGFADTDAERTINGIRFIPMSCPL